MLAYLKYLIRSSNQHGVHSPFVYHFITQALYKKLSNELHPLLFQWQKEKKLITSRKQKITNKALFYFNNTIFQEIHENNYTTNKTCYCSLKNTTLCDIEILSKKCHFFIIDHITSTKTSQQNWETIKKSTIFNVSIDLYDIGFLFIKKGQVKEHFTIRI